MPASSPKEAHAQECWHWQGRTTKADVNNSLSASRSPFGSKTKTNGVVGGVESNRARAYQPASRERALGSKLPSPVDPNIQASTLVFKYCIIFCYPDARVYLRVFDTIRDAAAS